jgi:predicted HicB family RNase H-like nuclease
VSNTMEYKGYVGSVEFSESDGLFFGKVIGIRGLISYEGTTAKTLIKNFHEAVDDYLVLCEERSEAPEKAYKGSFNVRVSPQLHKQAVISATTKGVSLNSFVEKALENYIATQG